MLHHRRVSRKEVSSVRVIGVNSGSLPETDDSSGEYAAQPVLPAMCWLPSVYKTLVCGLETFLIQEFLDWSWEILTSNGGLITEVWLRLEVGR